jgi:hypothetical protein
MSKARHVIFEYTEAFDNTFDSAISHLSQWSDEVSVIERLEGVVDEFEGAVSTNPLVYAQCQELVSLGVTEIRHAIKDGFRILYEVTEDNGITTIIVLLFLSQRQSIGHQLIDYCLMHKR